jgi:intracellular septation protein A
LSTLVFAGVMAVAKDVRIATGVAILAGLGEAAWMMARGEKVNAMQWTSLGLVIVLGSASLMTGDPRFVMFKPTIIYAAIGAAMLKRGWMTRYIPEDAQGLVDDLTLGFGYVWAALMFATAALNLVFALESRAAWTAFIAVFPLASKILLFATQYLCLQVIGRARHARGETAFTQG